MKSASFRLTLLAAALACTGSAQAATARTDVARPTDFAAVSVTQGPVICWAGKLMTCGRQVAGKFGLPAGSAAKSAYRFVEEEFLFDNGVGIFLQTAVGTPRKSGQPDWRRRLSFRKTPEGYQLVQIGVQYRCDGGAWSRESCGKAARAVASAKGAGVTAAAGAGAGGRGAPGQGASAQGASTSGPAAHGMAGQGSAAQGAAARGYAAGGSAPSGGAGAGGTTGIPATAAAGTAAADRMTARTEASGRTQAGAAGDRTRAIPGQPQAAAMTGRGQAGAPVTDRTAAAADINTRPGIPTESLQSPGTQEAPAAVPELDARWRPRQSAVEQDSAAGTAFGAGSQRRSREGSAPVAAPLAVPPMVSPAGAGAAAGSGVPGTGIGVAATAAMADIQQTSRARASGAMTGAPYAAAPAGQKPGVQPRQPAQGAGAAVAGTPVPHEQPADIVAANPSVSAEQLKQMREAEASLARATASSAPGVVDATHAPAAAPAPGMGQGSSTQRGATGAPGMQDLQGMTELPASANAVDAQGDVRTGGDARQDPQRTAAASSLRVPATQPASVHKAGGFVPVVMSPENAAQLARPCEQPIETCGKQVFDTLFEPEARMLAELPPNQSRRESFIYADQPVTSAVSLVTALGLPDDALAGQRIRIEFVRRGAGWVTVSAGRQYKCRRGDLARLEWTDRQCQ